jgi:serine/threonine protein kinase
MTNPCSLDSLEAALAGSLPESEQQALHRHLDECESCSNALDRMAEWNTWRQEAASLLTEDELDDLHLTHDDWAIDFTVEHLEPADEPNVLGRLGDFNILEIIGQGGMGVVLKAHDRKLNRYVAIKVLSPHLARNSLARKRFTREAQAAAAVVHPNVLAIHQVQPNGPLPYLVMPLVAGESVAERLTARGILDLTEALRIRMQAAAALAPAHEQGLVHRDVKPANILLEKGIERAVLTDFGLARAADDVTLTRWGVIAGTPQYMSPEQARGEPLDGRSDLFSLGCVLYEMATGVSPFRGDSVMATMRRLVDEQPRAMQSLNPELPPWFIAIVERLLQKDPSKRFGSAKEVSTLLEECLAHVQQPAAVPLPAGLPPSHRAPKTSYGSNQRRVFRNIGIAALLLAFSGFGAFMMLTAEPQDISGQWTGDDWGKVTLTKTGAAKYTGTYTDVFGPEPGKIELKWSRIERRYNGTWSEGKDRFGKLSVRTVGDEIRGGWTTNRKSEINPGTPALADLLWVRPQATQSKAAKPIHWQFGPVIERTLNDIKIGTNSMLNFETGKTVTPPDTVTVRRDFKAAMYWANSIERDAPPLALDFGTHRNADLVACADAGGRGLRIISGLAIQPANWDAPWKEVVDKVNESDRQLSEQRVKNLLSKGPYESGFSNLWAVTKGSAPGLTYEWTPGTEATTFYIKTRAGRIGVLQITGITDDPLKVTFRYKLLTSEPVEKKRAEQVEAKEVPWGRSHEGLEARLQSTRPTWAQADEIKFKIEIRNVGSRELTTSGLASLALEMDGKAFPPQNWMSTGLNPILPFGPDKKYSFDVSLKDFGSDKLGKPEPGPGKHSFVAILLNNSESSTLFETMDHTRGSLAVSNTVELEIKAKAAPKAQGAAIRYEFGPVVEKTLNDITVGPHSILNLESGDFLSPPTDVRDFEKAMTWMQSNHGDLVACGDGGGRGLRIVDGTAIIKQPADWDASPKEIVESIASMERTLVEYKKMIPGFQGDMGFSNLWAVGRGNNNDGHTTFYIKTRSGKMGTLQITGMTDDPHTVTFRYKLLYSEPVDQAPPNAGATTASQKPEPSQPDHTFKFWRDRRIWHVACSADGKLLAIPQVWRVEIVEANSSRTVTSVDLTTADVNAALASSLTISDFSISALAFSPDGNLLAVGTTIGQVKLFNTHTGELVRTLDDHDANAAAKDTPEKWKLLKRAMGKISSLAFSPDGGLLATCGESFADFARFFPTDRNITELTTGPGRLKIWDVKTGALKYDLAGHSEARAVAFSPDGNLLASAGEWRTKDESGTGVILSIARSGEKVRTIASKANGSTRSIAFSPDGKQLAFSTLQFYKENPTEVKTSIITLAEVASGMVPWQQTILGAAWPIAFYDRTVMVMVDGKETWLLGPRPGNKPTISVLDLNADGGRWYDFATAKSGRMRVYAGEDKERKAMVEVLGPDRPESSGESGPEKAATDWQLGPVIERTLNDITIGTNSMLNLETGAVVTPPDNVRDFDAAMNWSYSINADLVACGDSGGRGLRIVGGLAMQPANWDASPKEVAKTTANMERTIAEYKRTIPGFQGDMGFSNLWAVGRGNNNDGHTTFYIKTRSGRMGTLQITGMTDDPHTVTFRYKLLTRKDSSTPGIEKVEGRGKVNASISDAVSAFNDRARQSPVGKDQPPLTEDELIASIRWLSDSQKQHLSTEEIKELQTIAEGGYLPSGWEIAEQTTLDGVNGERFQAWMIVLRSWGHPINGLPSGDLNKRFVLGSGSIAYPFVHTIRRQLLWQIDAAGNRIELPELKVTPATEDATPLAAAINEFNAAHKSVLDIPQPPLTEDEVVAAIRYWKTHRNDAPVTNREFAAFQKIAETRQLPRGAEFELLTRFQNGDGGELIAWSVRIRMQKEGMTTATYAFEIRQQFIRSETSGEKNADTAWGPPSEDGLQAGLLLMPHRDWYVSGESVTPVFIYRNVGKSPVEASFPNIMTRSYYSKMNLNMKGGSYEQDEKPGGPVGWMTVQLPPGHRHEVRGLPILLGDGDRGKAETAIRVAVGQSVTLGFVVPHPVRDEQQSLSTGDLKFLIMAQPPKPGDFVPRHSAPSGDNASSFGPTSNGIKIRLESIRDTKPGDGIRFKIEIRNDGGRDLKTSGLASIALEIDAKVYPPRVWQGHGAIPVLPFGPGKTYTFEASLKDFGFTSTDTIELPDGKHKLAAILLDNTDGTSLDQSIESPVLARSEPLNWEIRSPKDELIAVPHRHAYAEMGAGPETEKKSLRAAMHSLFAEAGKKNALFKKIDVSKSCAQCHAGSDWSKATPPKADGAAIKYEFGPVVERTVQDIATGKNCCLKLETGELVTPPAGMKDMDQLSKWARKNGVDLVADEDPANEVSPGGRRRGLTTFDMFYIGPASWKGTTPKEAVDAIPFYEGQMRRGDRDYDRDLAHSPIRLTEYETSTLYIRTRTGKIGLLQIDGFTDNPRGVKLRYKLVNRIDPPKPKVR